MAPPTKAASTTAPAKAATKPGFALQLVTLQDLMYLAEILWKGGASQLPGMNRPEVVAGVILAGNEIGLSPAQSVDTIMVCNGKRTIYGDGAMALVLASGLLEKISEFVEGEGDEKVARAVTKRVGFPEETWTYSARQAIKADLWKGGSKKKDNWIKHEDDMLTNRCRSRWMKGRFADVLRGLHLHEVVADEQPEPAPPTVVQVTAPPPANALPPAMQRSMTAQQQEAFANKELPPAIQQAVEVAAEIVREQSAEVAAPAIAAATTVSATDGPVTTDQLREIATIKELFLASLNEKSPTILMGKWVELLQGYGVDSARKFTAAQAAAFIATEGAKNDPFGHPSTASAA